MNNRTQYVVDRTFQQRVALNLSVIVLFLPVVFLVNFYLAGMYALSHNPGTGNTPHDWGLVGDIVENQWMLIVAFVTVSLGIAFGLIFFYTHRIAGPIYRFRRLFDDVSEGRVGAQVHLRKGDCFENLASSVSRANATLAQSVSDLKTATAALTQKAESLNDPELREQIRVLQRVLDRYQVVSESAQQSEQAAPGAGSDPALQEP